MEKRVYSKPNAVKVQLRTEEAVLTGCKMKFPGAVFGPGGFEGWCGYRYGEPQLCKEATS